MKNIICIGRLLDLRMRVQLIIHDSIFILLDIWYQRYASGTIDSIHTTAILKLERGLGGTAQLPLGWDICVKFEATQASPYSKVTMAWIILFWV